MRRTAASLQADPCRLRSRSPWLHSSHTLYATPGLVASFCHTDNARYAVCKADLVKKAILSDNLFLIGKLISLHVNSFFKLEFAGGREGVG